MQLTQDSMAGSTIKFIFIFTVLSFISCNKDCPSKKEIKDIVSEYIPHVGEDKNITDKYERLIKVRKDSIDSYYVYRIFMEPKLLDLGEVANKFYKINGYHVVYFFKEIEENQKDQLLLDLEKQGFYSKSDKEFNSNFPEWVVFVDKKTSCQKILKNTNYFPLEKLLPELKEVKNN